MLCFYLPKKYKKSRQEYANAHLAPFFLSGQPWFRIEVPSSMDPDRLVICDFDAPIPRDSSRGTVWN